jgi:SAM-dependent methyltransferase
MRTVEQNGSPPDLIAMSDLITPMALRVTATLSLADHVQAGASSVAMLAERTGTDPEALGCLVRHLVTIGVLHEEGGELALSDLGALLREDDPGRRRRILDIEGGVGRAEVALLRLLDTVRTGTPAYEVMYGRGFWEDVDADAGLAQSLEELRPTEPGFDAHLVIDGCNWASASHVVDVGGGNGALLAELLRAHPHLRGTLLDLPSFAKAAEATFAAKGVGDRARAVGGSFFDPLPPGGGVYLLSGILYDWDDEHALRILGRCAEAAKPSGRVILSEISLDGWGRYPDSAMSIRMMTVVRGRERSIDKLEALGSAAGLVVLSRVEPTRYRSLIEFGFLA